MSSSPDVARTIDAVRTAFQAEARELGLKARLDADGDRVVPVFEAQFGASAEWLTRTFEEELRSHVAGGDAWRVPGSGAWRVAAANDEESAREVDAVRTALRRTRSKLVDGNSWISGGLPWPFPVADATLRERGVATYRAPARSPVDLDVRPGLVTIALPATDCGDVVSCGVWVPTPLHGDLRVSATYELDPWIAGEREACLGLYAVAPDGTFRLYAQRVSRATDPDYVVADVDGRCGALRATPRTRRGELRIERVGASIHAWHREDGGWTWLGRGTEGRGRSLVVGMKIWSSGVSGPLAARVTGLDVVGRAAASLEPPPPVRADPRQDS